MRIYEILREGRDAPLYHGCDLDAAGWIIRDDCIKANTRHAIDQRRVSGVSLTRNPRLEWGDVVLVLDQAKLVQRHRIVPAHHTPTGSDEAEEFVIGDIKPLAHYLLAVRLRKRAYDRWVPRTDQSEDLARVLRHPLLKVI